jgi:hypothetical protein
MTTTTNIRASDSMLVSLHISRWGNRVFERAVTEKVADDHHADRGMIATTKRLLPKDALGAIGALIAEARWHLYDNSLPWLDDGHRIMPAANYLHYTEKARELRSKFYAAVDAFIADYPEHRETARKALNGLFNEADYPTSAALRAKFAMEYHFQPMPQAADFRANLPEAEVARIQADLAARQDEALRQATAHLFGRVVETVTTVRDKLAAYAVTVDAEGKEKTEHPFRNTLLNGLRELCDVLPRLNLTNDPDLEAVRERLAASLCAADPEKLRDDDKARGDAIAEADAILKDMAGFCA